MLLIFWLKTDFTKYYTIFAMFAFILVRFFPARFIINWAFLSLRFSTTKLNEFVRHTERQTERTITQGRDWETRKATALLVACLPNTSAGRRAHCLLLFREWTSVPFQGGQGNPASLQMIIHKVECMIGNHWTCEETEKCNTVNKRKSGEWFPVDIFKWGERASLYISEGPLR